MQGFIQNFWGEGKHFYAKPTYVHDFIGEEKKLSLSFKGLTMLCPGGMYWNFSWGFVASQHRSCSSNMNNKCHYAF